MNDGKAKLKAVTGSIFFYKNKDHPGVKTMEINYILQRYPRTGRITRRTGRIRGSIEG